MKTPRMISAWVMAAAVTVPASVSVWSLPGSAFGAAVVDDAQESQIRDSVVKIIVTERKLLTPEKWDEMFSFERLINPDLVEE